MNIAILLIMSIILMFGLVVLFGAPYLPTLSKQKETALDMLDLRPGQTMLELGSGDGRMLKAAAERGIYAVGYELNPILVLFSIILTWRQRSKVKIIWGNYWTSEWPQAEGIYTFLLQKYMPKLDNKIIQECGKNVKLVSFAFRVPNRKPSAELQGLYLYKY